MEDIYLNLLFNIASASKFIIDALMNALVRLPEGLIFYGLLHGAVWLIMKIYHGEPIKLERKVKRRAKTAVSTVETAPVNVHSLFGN